MKPILKFFAFVWHALDGLRKVLHLLVLLAVFLLVLVALAPHRPFIPQKAALVLAPQGALVEQLTGDPVERAVAEIYGNSRAETLVRDLLDAIAAAKTDDRIKVLVLDLGSMSGGGIAKLEELATAIHDFRSSGKKVIALGESYDQAQYYLAAQADEIYLDPQGVVLIEGFGYFRTFLKGAIDKLDVDVHVFRAGKFKSYTDQYSRADMSEQEREESLSWLNALWSQYQKGVTDARGLEAGAINAYVNEMAPAARTHQGDMAALALERGLVTQILSRREVEEKLKTLVGEDQDNYTYQGVAHWDYLAAVHAKKALQVEGDHVGVIVASGEILDGDYPPGTIGSESTVRLLRQAQHDDSIKSVVLRIDSPGGSMLASEVIRREIDAIRAAGKPVIASMSSTAASGGYYIAMDADEIWASPATLTGSIGVFSVFPTLQRTLSKIGVTVDGVGTTPLADSLRLDRTLQEEAKEILQLSVDNAYSTFVGHVASAREKSFTEIDNVAQGRVWAGVDAAQNGLVDKLGSFRDALDSAAAHAKLGKDYKVEYIEASLGWRQAFAQQIRVRAAHLAASLAPSNEMMQSAKRLLTPLENELTRLARFSDSRTVYYYCPCTVN